ncbi:hypothetical protein B0T22DRAFT_104063 [Podospora appendiculata]|uniref:Uncharacterized protein n=1 Tax=Podospora appendiculata TaxID=314037 RepID=A0AAE1CIA3_9PEZI|nr:hypothetical protein B0T22DRAFT_104063 [Podospora appendiculata]
MREGRHDARGTRGTTRLPDMPDRLSQGCLQELVSGQWSVVTDIDIGEGVPAFLYNPYQHQSFFSASVASFLFAVIVIAALLFISAFLPSHLPCSLPLGCHSATAPLPLALRLLPAPPPRSHHRFPLSLLTVSAFRFLDEPEAFTIYAWKASDPNCST